MYECLACGFVFLDEDFIKEGCCPECGSDHLHDDFESDHEWDGFNSDAEADADVLRNAGWGSDEDYGYAEDVL